MNITENKELIKKIVAMRAWILLFLFVALISVSNTNFMSTSNILNVLRQTSINAIIASGMTFVILTAGIDLSVGSILAFSGAIAASVLVATGSAVMAIICAVFIGGICGAFNGVLAGYTKLQPFIITLISMMILRGMVMVFSNGRPISIGTGPAADTFYAFGSGYIFGIPTPVYIMLLVFAVIWFIQNHVRFGRYIYAIGNNEKGAILAGINTKNIKLMVYVISGICSAVASLILTARLSSAQPVAGTSYELDAIAAVVVGGTSLLGGKGSIVGTFAGALIIAILSNSLNLLNVSAYYQMIIKGMVILCAVFLDMLLEKKMKEY